MSGLAAQFLSLERRVGLDGVEHQRFDAFQILRSEGPLDLEIVVETVGGGRADGYLGLREQLHNGVGHHVGSRVAHTVAQRFYGVVNDVFGSSVVKHRGLPAWLWL